MTKVKAFADEKLTVAEMKISLNDRVDKTGKKRCSTYQHSLLFPHCFPKPSSVGSL